MVPNNRRHGMDGWCQFQKSGLTVRPYYNSFSLTTLGSHVMYDPLPDVAEMVGFKIFEPVPPFDANQRGAASDP